MPWGMKRGAGPGLDPTPRHTHSPVRGPPAWWGEGTARGENRQKKGTSKSFCDHYHQRSESRQAPGGGWSELTCVRQVCASVRGRAGGSPTPAQDLKGESLIRTRAQRSPFFGWYPGQQRHVPRM